MASVSDFIPDEGELQAQKTGGEKLSETAFSQNNKPAPKVTGGVTAGVSEFTPSAEDLKYQNYDTVGAKGESSLKPLAAAEKNIANPPKPPISGVGLTPGIQPKSAFTLAPEPAPPLEMPAVEYSTPQKGIFASRPSLTEGMSQGAKYTPPKIEPSIAERMGDSAKYKPPVSGWASEAAAEPITLKGIGKGLGTLASKASGPLAAYGLAERATEASPTEEYVKEKTGQEMNPIKAAIHQGISPGNIVDFAKAVSDPEQWAQWRARTSGKPNATATEVLPESAPQKNEAPAAGGEPKTATTTQAAQPASSEQPIEFSQNAWANQREKDAGSAISKGKGGDFKYTLNEAGKPVKINNATGELVPLTGGITRNLDGDNPLARETAARLAKANQPQQQGYQYEEPDDSGRAELEAMALSGPNSGMTPGQFASAKHRQSAALNALSAYDQNTARIRDARTKAMEAQMASDQFGAKLAEERAGRAENVGLKNRELSAAERHTKAQEEANLLNRQQEAEYKQARLAQGNRALELQEENAKNKPRTVMYRGQKLQGSPEELKVGKQNTNRDLYIGARKKALESDYSKEEAAQKAGEEHDATVGQFTTIYNNAKAAGDKKTMEGIANEFKNRIGGQINDYLED